MSLADPIREDGTPRAPPGGLGRATPPFAALRAFEALGRTGSLRRAARALGIDHAAVSRHVRALETWVGVLLVERLQSGGRLTEAGERYHRRLSAALQEIDTATVELMSPDTTAPLKIWCVAGFAAHWLAPRLGRFKAENPDYDIEVQPTEARPNFAAGEADADIRYIAGHRTPDRLFTGVKFVELSRPEVIAVASPDFLAAHGPIVDAAQFVVLPLIHKKDDEQWRTWLEAHGVPRVRKLAGPRLWYSSMTLEAARSGQGVALSNASLLRDDLLAGRLMRIDVGAPVTTGAYFFTTRADRWQSPQVASFRRWLQQAMDD